MPRFSTEAAILELNYDDAHRVQSNLNVLKATMNMEGYKVSVRDDSRLAYNWAFGTIKAPIEEVIEELAFIQWLSKHTNYQQASENGLRQIANSFKEKYPDINWTTIWTYVRQFGPDLFKYLVVEQCSAGVPDLTTVVS